jgi:hypothetical protein
MEPLDLRIRAPRSAYAELYAETLAADDRRLFASY